MPDEAPPLPYQSKRDAVADDIQTMHRSLRTWVLLCAVWAVGLLVWACYLALIAFVLFRVIL